MCLLLRVHGALDLLVRAQQALGFFLGILHRCLGGLAASECGLQSIVEGFGHALIVVRGSSATAYCN